MRLALPALVYLAAAILTRLPILHLSVLDWDESLYFLMADAWRAGHLPYTTIWDNKPIGIYAIFALFQWLIPGIAAIRVAMMLCVALLATTVFAITEILAKSRPAAWLAGTLLVLASLSNDGLSSNTEPFMAAFTTLAVLALLRGWPALLVGLLLGCGFMVKYVMAVEALAIFYLLLQLRGWRAALPFILGAALPLFAAALLYAANGQLSLWWQDGIASNFRRAAVPVPPGTLSYTLWTQTVRWGMLYIAALAFIPLARWRSTEDRFLLLWLLGGLIGAAAAKTFYDHFFLQFLPVLCIISGVLVSRLPARPILAGLLLASPGAAACVNLFNLRTVTDYTTRAGAVLAAQHPASLYVFDSQPILYAFTGTTPPTHYALPSILTGLTLPQVAGVDAPAEVARILATNPQFIVRRSDPPHDPNRFNPIIYQIADQAIAAHYTLWQHYPGIEIYRLNAP